MTARYLQAALSARPQIAASLEQHERAVMETGDVHPVTKELCAALCAAVNFCTPLLVEHRARAREMGVSVAKLNDLWEFARSAEYSKEERAALAAAVALSREPRALPAVVWEQLCDAYDEPSISEILCVIGCVNYTARLVNALDSKPREPS